MPTLSGQSETLSRRSPRRQNVRRSGSADDGRCGERRAVRNEPSGRGRLDWITVRNEPAGKATADGGSKFGRRRIGAIAIMALSHDRLLKVGCGQAVVDVGSIGGGRFASIPQSWIGCDGDITIELQASDYQLKLHPRPRHGYRGSRSPRSIVEIGMQVRMRCSARNVLSLDGRRPAMVPSSKE